MMMKLISTITAIRSPITMTRKSKMLIVNVKKFILFFIIKLKNKFAMVISKVNCVYNAGASNIKYRARAGLDIFIPKIYVGVSRVKKVICAGLVFIKEVVSVTIGYLKTLVKKVLNSIMLITLDKLFALLLGAIFFAGLKYAVSGCLSLNWEDFNLNFSLAFIVGIFRYIVKDLFFEYLNIKGVNYNIYQLLFGLNKHRMSPNHDLGEFKPRLFNSMDIDDEGTLGKYLDKGKGVSQDSDRMSISGDSDNDKPLEKGKGVLQDKNSSDEESKDKIKLLDKGKGVDKNMHPNHPSFVNEGTPSTVSPFGFSNTISPSTSTTAYMPNFPPKTNPGPGFNVPGGVVPLRDDICKYIDYNSHVLRQFRTMDLETAIEQRNNNLKSIEVLKRKLEFGQIKLAKEGVGEVPKNDRELWLKQKVAGEAEWIHDKLARADGRQTLLLSRIEYILIEEEKKKK
jgi:hypothetical protein